MFKWKCPNQRYKWKTTQSQIEKDSIFCLCFHFHRWEEDSGINQFREEEKMRKNEKWEGETFGFDRTYIGRANDCSVCKWNPAPLWLMFVPGSWHFDWRTGRELQSEVDYWSIRKVPLSWVPIMPASYVDNRKRYTTNCPNGKRIFMINASQRILSVWILKWAGKSVTTEVRTMFSGKLCERWARIYYDATTKINPLLVQEDDERGSRYLPFCLDSDVRKNV